MLDFFLKKLSDKTSMGRDFRLVNNLITWGNGKFFNFELLKLPSLWL